MSRVGLRGFRRSLSMSSDALVNSKQEENDFQQRKQQQQQQQAATRKSQSADDANRGTADTPTIIIDNNKVVVTPLLSGLSEDASTPRKAKHHVRGQSQPLPIFDEITTATATRTSVARGGNGIQQSISITNSETVSSSTERSSAMLSARDLQASHAERVLVVGKGVALTADVTSCDTVVVEGQFKGNIKTGIFVLAEGGYMEGVVRCEDGRLGGTMKATMVASKTLTIGKAAVVTGDVVYEVLEIIDGGRLQGKLTHFSSTHKAKPSDAVAGNGKVTTAITETS